MLDVTIGLLCSRRPGTLSRVIRELRLLGVEYNNHQIEFSEASTTIVVNGSGELNCTRDRLVQVIMELPEVHMLQHCSITQDGKEITEFRTTASDAHISAGESLTPVVKLAAEKRLADIMGPVASYLVETTAGRCNNAGELFLALANELDNSDERLEFLSIVENIKGK